MKTDWKATDNPRWPLTVLLSVIVAAVPILLQVLVEHEPISYALAFPDAAVLGFLGAARSRLR